MKLPFHDKKFVLLLTTVALVILLEILSLVGITLPLAPYIFGVIILGMGYEVLWHGIKALFKLKFSSISLLMLIAVCGAYYLKQYSEASVVIVLYVLGERLEDLGIETSKSALNELVSNSPKTAILKTTGASVPVEQVAVGSIIVVKPGESIPLDGKIVFGSSSIDEAAITGEPLPREKHLNDLVFAGTLNKNGFLEIITTKTSKDTTFAKIIELTFEAQAAKSPTQQFIQKFSKYYTPSILFIATSIFLYPLVTLGHFENEWILQAISLLVIACPCALVISTPVAIYAAIGNASSRGALIKGGKYLELLAHTSTIALDKTRTITYGSPIVSDVFPLNGFSRTKLLACTSGAELFSEHPLAEAIVAACKHENTEPHSANEFQSIAGKGATAHCTICDDPIYIGNLNFIKEHRQSVNPEAEQIITKLANEGKTSVVVSFGDGVAGIIGLTDEIKPDSLQAIRELKSLNILPVMLTGDSVKAAEYVAKQVGIEEIHGGLLPEGKSEEIKKLLQQHDHVVMVGDGINDAPALAQSTIGIAMGAAGSSTAIETANIALMNDKLSLIPFLIRLSKATLSRIKVNTISAISIKVIFILIALSGHGNLVMAIAADVGVTLVVILMSLNLMRFEAHPTHLKAGVLNKS